MKFTSTDARQAAVDAGVAVIASSPSAVVTIQPARVADGVRKPQESAAQQLVRRIDGLCKSTRAVAAEVGASATPDERIRRQLDAVASVRNTDESAAANRAAVLEAVRDLARIALGPAMAVEP